MLFWKECKKILWSIAFLLYVAVTVLDLYTQDVFRFGEERITVPFPDGNYGMKNEEIPEIIMPAALQELYGEFAENNYRTYPIGFIKYVKLNEKERAQVAEILSEITGTDAAKILSGGAVADTAEFYAGSPETDTMEITAEHSEGDISVNQSGGITIDSAQMAPDGKGGYTISMDGNTGEEGVSEEDLSLTVREDLSYDEFKVLMQEVDDILGGGSSYASQSLIRFGSVPVTYEEAVRRYEFVRDYDRITGGYARLFSDYAGVTALSILPVFLAVILCMKDRQSGMPELLYTRQASSLKIVFMRFLALVTAEMLPILILSYVSNMSVWKKYPGVTLDYLAPLKYDIGWLMPTAMIVTAVGMFLTELTDTPIAVAVCGLWWLVDMNQGYESVQKNYALFRLAPRHNSGAISYFRTEDFVDNLGRLAANRLFFAAVSVLFLFLTVLVYEAKRKGRLHGYDKVKRAVARMGNRKKQSEA